METLKATSNQKPAPAAPVNPLASELAAMEGLPIYELRFRLTNGAGPDLPVNNSNGGVANLRIRAGLEITLLPKVNLYRVVQKQDGGVRTFYVPREWATFEPYIGGKLQPVQQ